MLLYAPLCTIVQAILAIISPSLSISIASNSTPATGHSPGPSVCPQSELWQNSWLDLDAIWSGERGRSRNGFILWGWWSSKRKGEVLWVNLGHPIVANGDCVAQLRRSLWTDWAVIWRGEWGGPRHWCVRWGSTCLKGKGLFLAWFQAFFGIYGPIRLNGRNDVLLTEKRIWLMCEKLTIFTYGQHIVGIYVSLAFW